MVVANARLTFLSEWVKVKTKTPTTIAVNNWELEPDHARNTIAAAHTSIDYQLRLPLPTSKMESKTNSAPPSISIDNDRTEYLPPPPYESPTMNDLERGPSPGFERRQPLFDLLAGTFDRQDSDTNCLVFCFSLLVSVLASLVVFILYEIG